MNPYLEQVEEFHAAFQYRHPSPLTVDLSCSKTNALREDLIREELHELEAALSKRDPVEVLDALCDLQYVLSGAVVALGFAKFDDAFAEVHRSNLTKLWSESEVNACVECYTFQKSGDKFIARRDDGKIMKSPSYSPVNLAPFV